MSAPITSTLTADHTIEHKEYITLAEQRQIVAIMLDKQGSAAAFEANNKTLELIIVSIDGNSDNIVKRVTEEMPITEAKAIQDLADSIFSGKKKGL